MTTECDSRINNLTNKWTFDKTKICRNSINSKCPGAENAFMSYIGYPNPGLATQLQTPEYLGVPTPDCPDIETKQELRDCYWGKISNENAYRKTGDNLHYTKENDRYWYLVKEVTEMPSRISKKKAQIDSDREAGEKAVEAARLSAAERLENTIDNCNTYKISITGSSQNLIVEQGRSSCEKKYDANVIENFSDIKLKDFYNASGCSSGKFKNEVVGSSKKGLFKKYADNIKTMVNNIKTQNDKLLGIIDQLFVFSVDSATGNKKVSINPVLNEQKLSEITKQTRDIILDLYTGCENNFIEGLKIYEAIIRNQQFETTKSQIDNLKTAVGEKLPELGEDLNTLSTNKTQEQDENEDEDENLKTPEDQENQDLKTPEDKENQDLKTPEDQENQDLKTPEDQENQDDKIESPENQESKTNDDIKSQKENQSGILENMLNTIKNTVTEDKKVEQEINTVKSSHQNETMKNSLSLDSEINKTEPSLTDKIKTYKTQKMNEPKLQDQSNE